MATGNLITTWVNMPILSRVGFYSTFVSSHGKIDVVFLSTTPTINENEITPVFQILFLKKFQFSFSSNEQNSMFEKHTYYFLSVIRLSVIREF